MKKKIVSILGMMLLATACQQDMNQNQDTDNNNSTEMDAGSRRGNKTSDNGRSSTRQQMNKKSKPANSCSPKCDTDYGGRSEKSCGPCCDSTEAMSEEVQDITRDQEAHI